MAMGGPIPMPTDSALLTLTQWLSPAYPVGAFAYSHGLEAAGVTDKDGVRDWLTDVLTYGAGQSDALFLAAAFRADTPEALRVTDATCRAFAPSKERLLETDQQGAAFCRVTAQVWGLQVQGLTYPVAVGRAAALAALPLGPTLRLYLQAFTSNLIAAAQRLTPLGQTDGQALLHALAPLITGIADAAQPGDLQQLSGTAFLADIASMKHETQYSRIFRT